MLIASYNEWFEQSRQDLLAANTEVDCPHCHGNGWNADTCDCCGSELDDEFCDACLGSGKIPFSEIDNLHIRNAVLTDRTYFKEVIQDLKRYCAYTGSDFLEVVAPFIQAHRSGRTRFDSNHPRISYHGPD